LKLKFQTVVEKTAKKI